MKALHFGLILLVLVSAALAGQWQIEAVDSSGTADVGAVSSLALDSSDYSHISFYDFTNVDLNYARWGEIKAVYR